MDSFIIDTNVFAYLISDDIRLLKNKKLFDFLNNYDHKFYISAISILELSGLNLKGSIDTKGKFEEFLRFHLKKSKIKVLPISKSHFMGTANLNDIHRDPFDRTLIAQSIYTKFPLVHTDGIIARYRFKQHFFPF